MDVLLKSDHDTKKYREPHSNSPRKQQGKERTRFYRFNAFIGFGMKKSLTAWSKKKVQTRLIKSDQDAMPRRLFYKKGLYIV